MSEETNEQCETCIKYEYCIMRRDKEYCCEYDDGQYDI